MTCAGSIYRARGKRSTKMTWFSKQSGEFAVSTRHAFVRFVCQMLFWCERDLGGFGCFLDRDPKVNE